MNMSIKKYSLAIFVSIFFIIWFGGSITLFICSNTDFCVMKKIQNSQTLDNFIPVKTCDNTKTKGINILNSEDNLKVLVIPPKNHFANKKYPLILVYPPAGKTKRKSELFYKNLTKESNYYGQIIAYTDYKILNEDNLLKLSNVKKEIIDKYCIDEDNISILGHSDGATNAAMINYRSVGNKTKNLIISAVGINEKTLSLEQCPYREFSTLILHSKNDKLFYNYGEENFSWLAQCSKCELNIELLKNGCKKIKNCKRKIFYCEGNEEHSEWPNRNKLIMDFLLNY